MEKKQRITVVIEGLFEYHPWEFAVRVLEQCRSLKVERSKAQGHDVTVNVIVCKLDKRNFPLALRSFDCNFKYHAFPVDDFANYLRDDLGFRIKEFASDRYLYENYVANNEQRIIGSDVDYDLADTGACFHVIHCEV